MEIIAILTAMKEMGFEAGQILSLIVMYFMLRRDLIKTLGVMIKEAFDRLIGALNSLEESHNNRLKKIEDHIGLK